PEFIGRLPVMTALDELTEEQLARILTEPRHALTRQFAKLLAFDGVELEFTPDAVAELAAEARRKGTGARALRALVEKLMRDVMFEIPGSDEVARITVHRAAVRGEASPILHRKPSQAAA
ncbi:MAG: ATP-dependent Clp protease ATP-binding subunit ClpX, partial [Verrucomicrobiota bacterium]